MVFVEKDHLIFIHSKRKDGLFCWCRESDRSRDADEECLCMFVSASVCIRLSVYAR